MHQTTDLALHRLQRRNVIRGLALTALGALAAASVGAQAPSTAVKPLAYRRRRISGLGDILVIGGIVAAIAGWVFLGGKRARRKAQEKAAMDERLARCREQSRKL